MSSSFWNRLEPLWTSQASQQNGPGLFPLRQYSLVSLQGPDAEKFMQGQFTCDLREVTESVSRLGACCNPKGRMLAQFRILRGGPEQFFLRCPTSVAEQLVAHLGKFIVFYKCEMTLLTDAGVLGYCGDPTLLRSCFGSSPEAENEAVVSAGAMTIRVPGEQPRFEIWVKEAADNDWLSKLISQSELEPEALWELQEVRAGLGEVYAETREEFIPQMLNLQSLEGISFRKGCYTGQEIVARMQYLGKLKKRMYLFAAGAAAIRPGDSVHRESRSVGTVVRVAGNTPDQQLLLAVVDCEAAESGEPLTLNENPSLTLNLHPLPYEVSESGQSRPPRQSEAP